MQTAYSCAAMDAAIEEGPVILRSYIDMMSRVTGPYALSPIPYDRMQHASCIVAAARSRRITWGEAAFLTHTCFGREHWGSVTLSMRCDPARETCPLTVSNSPDIFMTTPDEERILERRVPRVAARCARQMTRQGRLPVVEDPDSVPEGDP